MKEKLILRHCTSRKQLESLAIRLGKGNTGSRQSLMNRIMACSYKEIKEAL